MSTFIVEAPIDKVLDNPNRNYKNYPIDEAQIYRLKASFDETGGIWHALPARPGPEKGTYELCFGHHRKVAAERLNYKKIRLEVGEHDDDQMLLMMTVENGTQRVNNAAAALDSVAAITRRLAYALLRYPDFESSTIIEDSPLGHALGGRGTFARERTRLLSSDGVGGIGEGAIHNYAPKGSLDLAEIRSSIATLKDDGGYQQLIEEVTQQVNAELAIEEAERVRLAKIAREAHERQLKAAEELAERQEREAKAAEEAQRKREQKAHADAIAAELRRAAAEEKKQAAEADREEKARKAAEKAEQDAAAERARLEVEREQRELAQAKDAAERAEREKARVAAREAEQREAERREDELTKLTIKAAEADPILDRRVVPFFRNHHALSRFREIVTDPNNRHWFPLAEQLGHVRKIVETFEEKNKKKAADHLTANYVASYLNGYLRECLRGKREDEKRLRTLDQSVDVNLTKALKGANWVQGAIVDIIKLIKEGASVPDDFEAQLRGLEERTTNQIAALRKATGYVKGGKEIAGQVVARPRLAISNR